jgi:hypothetical protein
MNKMAYDKKKVYAQTLEIIEKHTLIFIEDIVALLPLRKQTFYDFFPIGSDEMDNIKSALEKNRVSMKSNMRKKWYKSDNPTLQVALMKLIANEDEAARLSGQTRDNTNANKMVFVWGGNNEADK